MEEIKALKEQYARELMGKANVVAVGVGYKIVGGRRTDELAIMVFVSRKVAPESLAPEELIPAQIEGVATDVVESGTLYAHQGRTDRFRPAPGGVSIGHYQVTAGTFGVVVRDRNSGERLILSNNHVLANSNSASPGDAILQPGSADGGTVTSDVIGTLLRFEQIRFESSPIPPPTCSTAVTYAAVGNLVARVLGSDHRVVAYRAEARIEQEGANLVDAAVARPQNSQVVLDDILEIGTVSGTAEAVPGLAVRKSGRTTGLTTGQIMAIEATATINYGAGRTAVFEEQIISGAMSQPGDSGSLLVEANSQRAVGLLFAGSTQSTIYNPIGLVEQLLNVTMG
jgi:hypothetical protein